MRHRWNTSHGPSSIDAVFVEDLERFLPPIVAAGRVNSLAQTLLKLTSPGVPDIYQGTELWDLSLVDPDNRRPVDFEARSAMLADIEAAVDSDPRRGPGPDTILAAADEGLPKLWVTARVLEVRRNRPDLFGPEAAYRPVASSGSAAAHVVAFERAGGAVTVVPRLSLKLAGGRAATRLIVPASRWGDTRIELDPGRWRDVLSGGRITVRADAHQVRVARLLDRFPVALLVREDG